ncbi:TPA: glucokinase [Neisseria meningitidis]|jgi:glucokinase (EC 2.7.1.2)|uniref:Glucokinase n=10 Tax=Neisseria meningitidis TaxID=487 RepID=GLK_NEIMB|nr:MULTISPECIES: glucokinase [Neisseria]A1KUL0.1 RecName: Full=Glucokinase; AltName: Full=Glucose kinase [Neisseria meningitidis FAM18]A9M041.1 RecName: Full=Glucokinase; AltName: Full=Glucose kinase [Neisseria meningitidis 053442]P64253.1 RecName: Full=Glucokinase; AltName: Full=Glucose kinase [Neisseria meningitidis Z2491]P64254.1 RecName: Full=Glucokinase; AltName: Full=Glucose kinase [Neisseria meningitidis MC58]EGC53217.1 glucokinase [Neisseria meningitidis OX99.30304]EGC64973.1 glucokin
MSSTPNKQAGYPRLVADIGGTNARFALETAPRVIEKAAVLPCKDYDTVTDAVRAYLNQSGATAVRHAAFAIANPILGDWVQMTNHHWAFSIETTRQTLGLDTLILLNDFTAQALAVTQTSSKDLMQVGGQKPVEFAPKAVIGPGTGLGVSGLVHSHAGWVALAGEGGHTSFPPFDDMEVLIWQYAKNKYGHVSAERFLSGAGLSLVYEALAAKQKAKPAKLMPSEITEKALSGASPLCRQTLDIFCAMLGTVASNLALTLGARGGVYLCGGIIPRVLEYFKTSPFRSRFENKGRFEAYLAAIPVYVVLSEFPGISGAAAALDNHLRNV